MALALIVKPNAFAELKQLETLEDLQAAVGGYIESFFIGHDISVLVNEDGKYNGSPENRVATFFCHQRGLPMSDWITGNLIILGPCDEDGEYTDIPQALVGLFELETPLKETDDG